MQKLILVIFSISISFAKANFLNDNNGRFGKLNFNNKNYCFKVSETSIKPIKNLGNCENIDGLYATNQGLVCLETSDITCNKTNLKGDSYSWGEGGMIKIYSSIGGLQSDTPISDFSSTKDEVESNSSNNEMSGEELYKKAKEYFDKKDYQKAYEYAQRSADKKYKGGYFGLGLAYEKGYGVVEKDIDKAIFMYKKAAKLGHVAARGKVKRLTKKDSDNGTSSIKQGVWKNGQYKCTGNYINFDGSSVFADSYWENVTVSGSKITVPKFGEYRFVGNQNKADWYLLPGKEKEGRYNFVKVMTNNNNDSRSVTFSIKKGANPLQMQGQCSIKNLK